MLRRLEENREIVRLRIKPETKDYVPSLASMVGSAGCNFFAAWLKEKNSERETLWNVLGNTLRKL